MSGDDIERGRVFSSVVVITVFVAAVVGLGWLWTVMQSSSAAFADREVFSGNHLGAGTVDVAVGDATVVFAAEKMAAGDTASGRLELVNRGNLPLRYSLSVTSDDSTFDEVFELVAWDGSIGCDGAPPASAGRWQDEPSGVSPRIGALATGDTQLVCLFGTLSLSAPSSLQGRRVEVTVLVQAEHDAEVSS